jgi:hypothetical protein
VLCGAARPSSTPPTPAPARTWSSTLKERISSSTRPTALSKTPSRPTPSATPPPPTPAGLPAPPGQSASYSPTCARAASPTPPRWQRRPLRPSVARSRWRATSTPSTSEPQEWQAAVPARSPKGGRTRHAHALHPLLHEGTFAALCCAGLHDRYRELRRIPPARPPHTRGRERAWACGTGDLLNG